MVNNTYEARIIDRIEGKKTVTFENRRHENVRLCGKGQPLPKQEVRGKQLDVMKVRSTAHIMARSGVPRSEITLEAIVHPNKIEMYRKDQVKRAVAYLDKMYHL